MKLARLLKALAALRAEEAHLLEEAAAELALEEEPPKLRRVRGAGALLAPGDGDADLGRQLLASAGLGRRRAENE